MLSIDRRKYIIEQLNKYGSVKVEQLSEELGVTSMTIRRDLDKLEAEVAVQRTHGGAVLYSHLHFEEKYEEKKIKNNKIKQKLAMEAIKIIRDNTTIFVDAGTTTYELAQLLKSYENLIIITSDLKIATLLYASLNDIYLIGGKVERSTGTVYESDYDSFLDRVNIDYAFFGTSAISNDGYLSTTTLSKANLKRRLFDASHKNVLLADQSKFGRECFAKIVALTEFDVIISDQHFEEHEKDKLDLAEVTINVLKEEE